ncbi:hypothetical protein [Vagococcus lutrae]|uniref:hypothetical protein n=1 Tax=Vagococcus lutrae TaxID=81947 RepID=UPI002891097D|nr:hypothetical protein [Vagococcus lutrae]MDT2843017.1 hypothetical protein [Vagococcus lutrae]
MTNYQYYPMLGEEKEEKIVIKEETEMQIGIGTHKNDSTKKVYRVLANIKEVLDDKKSRENEEVIREFAIKIYYYIQVPLDSKFKEEDKYITLAILKDLDSIIQDQTKHSKRSMTIETPIKEFINDNNLEDIEVITK